MQRRTRIKRRIIKFRRTHHCGPHMQKVFERELVWDYGKNRQFKRELMYWVNAEKKRLYG